MHPPQIWEYLYFFKYFGLVCTKPFFLVQVLLTQKLHAAHQQMKEVLEDVGKALPQEQVSKVLDCSANV